MHEPVDDNCIDTFLSKMLTAPNSLALACIEASILPQRFEELEETMGIQKGSEHFFPALTVAEYEDLHAPMPSFENRIPMPDFLYPGMPNLELDHSEDTVPEEKVTLPFSDLIDLFHTTCATGTSTTHPEGITTADGSVGNCLSALMIQGMATAREFEEAFEHTPLAKSTSSSAKRTGARRSRWKSRKTRSRFNFEKGKSERCGKEEVIHKSFEDLTVGELCCTIRKMR